jgi:hypothetical protein
MVKSKKRLLAQSKQKRQYNLEDYAEFFIKLKDLKHANSKYTRDAHILKQQRESDFYKELKTKLDDQGMLNPLVMLPNSNKLFLGNNRLVWLWDNFDDNANIRVIKAKYADHDEEQFIKENIYK